MNKTFNTADHSGGKNRKLHQSDMNMALVRKQLHKEMLVLILYKYQTMNHRLRNINTDSMPQFYSNWCINIIGSNCPESPGQSQIFSNCPVSRKVLLKLYYWSGRGPDTGTNIVVLVVVPYKRWFLQ